MLVAYEISTHTPLAGRDPELVSDVVLIAKFLLTRPLRDVTTHTQTTFLPEIFLLTRPLRDVTFLLCYECRTSRISTHTPLAGRD